MREIVFDTETTGFDPKSGDRMVEIGCIELLNRVETGATFHAYFNPDRDMPAEAERVHGLSTAFLAAKPRFADTCADLIAFIGDAPLIAHNAGFDFGFLNHELTLCGRPAVCMSRMIDTLALARTRHPGAKHTLDALCTRYGIDRSHRTLHGALVDAQLLAQLYVELTGGRQIGLGLRVETIAEAVVEVAAAAPAIVRPARPHAASAGELERHTAFMAAIADPLWGSPATAG